MPLKDHLFLFDLSESYKIRNLKIINKKNVSALVALKTTYTPSPVLREGDSLKNPQLFILENRRVCRRAAGDLYAVPSAQNHVLNTNNCQRKE